MGSRETIGGMRAFCDTAGLHKTRVDEIYAGMRIIACMAHRDGERVVRRGADGTSTNRALALDLTDLLPGSDERCAEHLTRGLVDNGIVDLMATRRNPACACATTPRLRLQQKCGDGL